MHAKSFRKTTKPKIIEKVVPAWKDGINLQRNDFTVDRYDFYRTDIFHDFTAKNKVKFIITDYIESIKDLKSICHICVKSRRLSRNNAPSDRYTHAQKQCEKGIFPENF